MACEESSLGWLVRGRRGFAHECSGELEDVTRECPLRMRYDEWNATIHRQHGEAPVRNNRAVDRSADRGLHVTDADPLRRVGTVDDEAYLAAVVLELVSHL